MFLHHFGIVVDNLAEAIPLFTVWLKATPLGGIVEDQAQGARIQLFVVNGLTLLELVEVIPGSGSTLHSSGQFHLCYTVPDLDAEMQRLHELGAVVTHPVIESPVFEKRRMAFLATHSGQLLELLEDSGMVTQ